MNVLEVSGVLAKDVRESGVLKFQALTFWKNKLILISFFYFPISFPDFYLFACINLHPPLFHLFFIQQRDHLFLRGANRAVCQGAGEVRKRWHGSNLARPETASELEKTVRSRRKFFLGSSSLFINCPFNLKKSSFFVFPIRLPLLNTSFVPLLLFLLSLLLSYVRHMLDFLTFSCSITMLLA